MDYYIMILDLVGIRNKLVQGNDAKYSQDKCEIWLGIVPLLARRINARSK